MRRRGLILIIVGIVLAVGAGALVYSVLQQQQQQAQQISQTAAPAQPSMKIPVAARPLEPGTTITPNDFVLKDFPLDIVSPAAITDTQKLNQRVLIQPVAQGETFQENRFLGSVGAAISQQLQPGFVLLAYPIADLLSQSGLIQDGDHLDMMLTIKRVPDPNAPQQSVSTTNSTAYTVQNIEVLKVLRPRPSEENPNPQATALLLSVTPDDAIMIKFVKDSGGVIDFVLRSPLDTDPFQPPSVNEAELILRYGFK